MSSCSPYARARKSVADALPSPSRSSAAVCKCANAVHHQRSGQDIQVLVHPPGIVAENAREAWVANRDLVRIHPAYAHDIGERKVQISAKGVRPIAPAVKVLIPPCILHQYMDRSAVRTAHGSAEGRRFRIHLLHTDDGTS